MKILLDENFLESQHHLWNWFWLQHFG